MQLLVSTICAIIVLVVSNAHGMPNMNYKELKRQGEHFGILLDADRNQAALVNNEEGANELTQMIMRLQISQLDFWTILQDLELNRTNKYLISHLNGQFEEMKTFLDTKAKTSLLHLQSWPSKKDAHPLINEFYARREYLAQELLVLKDYVQSLQSNRIYVSTFSNNPFHAQQSAYFRKMLKKAGFTIYCLEKDRDNSVLGRINNPVKIAATQQPYKTDFVLVFYAGDPKTLMQSNSRKREEIQRIGSRAGEEDVIQTVFPILLSGSIDSEHYSLNNGVTFSLSNVWQEESVLLELLKQLLPKNCDQLSTLIMKMENFVM